MCSGELWSGLSESNRHLNLGKVPYYHYTKAAQLLSIYITSSAAATSIPCHNRSNFQIGFQETWLTRADLTTGERLCRSAKRVALSLSV